MLELKMWKTQKCTQICCCYFFQLRLKECFGFPLIVCFFPSWKKSWSSIFANKSFKHSFAIEKEEKLLNKKTEVATFRLHMYVFSVWCYRLCHGFRLTKRDDYFWVDFDHFWIKQYFWRQLGQYWNLTRALNWTTIGKFCLPKSAKRSVHLRCKYLGS